MKTMIDRRGCDVCIARIAYVAVVAALAAAAFRKPNEGFTWSEAAAMLLTLPMLVPALPVVYVGGAAAWNLTGADTGGPMWPVTVAYAVMFGLIAVANLWLWGLILRRSLSRAGDVPGLCDEELSTRPQRSSARNIPRRRGA
jgi:hypothetical protein